MSSFEPPYRRYAIRLTTRGNVTWWTDDGTGCDEAEDNTEWDPKRLVTFVSREECEDRIAGLREWARERGLSLRVVPVWEYPGGVYELQRRPK